MTNIEIAKLLKKVAAAYTILSEEKNKFRIIAYTRAADTIEHLTSEAKDLWDDGKLSTIPGIGPSLALYLDELFKTGKVKHFEQLLKKLPPAMFYLLDISGMGPKRAYFLTKNLGLNPPEADPPLAETKDEKVIDELKKAGKAGKIAKIPGFGEKSQSEILKNIEEYKKVKEKKQRIVLPYAGEIAKDVITYLRRSPDVKRVDPLGSLRRMVSTVGDIDIAVVTNQGEAVIDWFIKYPKAKRILEAGKTTASVILGNNLQIDLMVQPEESYGTLLAHFTGSKMHNIHLREIAQKKGWSVSEYGITIKSKIKNQKSKIQSKNKKLIKFKNEESFYQFLGMDWIPPELREDTGEIEAAQRHQLPKLVNLKDIKGDLHIHSNYDLEPSHDLGLSSFEEIIDKARELKYEYIGISDHSPSVSNHTKDQIYDILSRRKEYFKQKKLKTKSTRVFIMLEVDILANGKLSIEDKSLELLDGVIASIHSSFNQSKEIITKRILQALENPKVKIIGHPTGRLLGEREGYEVDWDKLFDSCLKNKKALEISAWPQRLDLPDVLVRETVKNGVKMVINSDSHRVDQMSLINYGVSVARRGWANKTDILNSLSYNEFSQWLINK